MSEQRPACLVAILALISIPLAGLAHHGPDAEPLYDTSTIVELDGVVTEVFWRNPHVRFRIRVTEGAREGEIWELGTSPAHSLERSGLSRDLLSSGDAVKVAGVVSRRKPRTMGLRNLLLPNGLEFAGNNRRQPLRFSDQRLSPESRSIDQVAVNAATREAHGIFRVWSRADFDGSESRHDDSVVTEAALAAKAAFNPLTDDPILDCVQHGMPQGLLVPTPAEFIDEGEAITLRIQEYDIVRTIHMGDDADPREQPVSPQGYSVGRFDGETLVVTTTRIDWPHSDRSGVPQSADAKHIERFTPSADGTRMEYELTSIDPVYLATPSVRYGHFRWVPGNELARFDCALWE